MSMHASVLLALAALPLLAQVESRMLPVPKAADGETQVPVTTIRGAEPGPVLAIIAGNHGYEYPPVLAVQRLRSHIDAKQLRGRVILVHVANLPSFLHRTVYRSPVDQKNLNRVYPGKPDGTLSERIAHVITKEVIEKADVLLDLHGGDGNESLRPYVYQSVTGDTAMDRRIEALVRASLFDHIVIDRGRPKDPANAVYCSNTAITRGKPALTLEAGYLGSADEASVTLLERGVLNILRHLGMLPGTALRTGHPVFFDPAEVVSSPATGVLTPEVEKGQTVARGAVLATIRDWFGATIAEVRSPFAGVVLYIVATPPISQGEPVAFVGAPAMPAQIR